MSPDGFVRLEHVWKRFRADRHRQLLRDEVSRVRQRLRGDAAARHRWALRDVSFEVEPGGSLALIGANGSGKSTMLKILAGIMFPTYGRLEAVGRIGALIEVRAGIHPDLTGRENVYMYGSLLGLRRSEVRRRFDEIVEFAELEDAIDRQVKFYSSGMGMRLGFAVAAFLEPDIMVVDEVLAVGDATFQQRCLDRMREVMAQGTTLLYVSHDLATVEAMCERTLWLDSGITRAVGDTRDVVAEYRRSVGVRSLAEHAGPSDITVVLVRSSGPNEGPVRSNETVRIHLDVSANERRAARIVLGISEGSPVPIFVVQEDVELAAGPNAVRCDLGDLPLPEGNFTIYVTVLDDNGRTVRPWSPIGQMDVEGVRLRPMPTGVVRLAPIAIEASWHREG